MAGKPAGAPEAHAPGGYFDHMGGADIEYRTSDGVQARTCRWCGGSETVNAVGKGKSATFPGYLDFVRLHIGCSSKGGKK